MIALPTQIIIISIATGLNLLCIIILFKSLFNLHASISNIFEILRKLNKLIYTLAPIGNTVHPLRKRKPYRHFTNAERVKINLLMKSGLSGGEIANHMKMNPERIYQYTYAERQRNKHKENPEG